MLVSVARALLTSEEDNLKETQKRCVFNCCAVRTCTHACISLCPRLQRYQQHFRALHMLDIGIGIYLY